MNQTMSLRDRPGSQPEIEITPEMVAAGVAVLEAEEAVLPRAALAEAVYIAMAREHARMSG